MQNYLDNGVFDEHKKCFILVERTTIYGRKRVGLIISIDLEAYDYKPLSTAPIKATEMTVESRIPVRVKIREEAPLELPHIMLLMDDVNRDIIEHLYAKRHHMPLLYDFELNANGGHIKGYKVEDTDTVISKLMNLVAPETLIKRYGSADNPFLFAVGDGNHSLATAKACWDKIKDKVYDKENHPARYALCELVNLYDDDLIFEPIHRVLFNAGDEFIDGLMKVSTGSSEAYIVYKGERQNFPINSFSPKAIAEIQEYIDSYIKTHKEASVDYVHGTEHTLEVAKDHGGIAIFMPTIKKNELFRYVLREGVLCRKAFSMGEAEEKRYYFECKRIKV